MRIGVLLLLLIAGRGYAAGGVVGEPGSCMIEIGLYTAHFTIYQSDTSGDEEFCEDLPDIGKTLFVLDYLHGSMKEVAVDFRIIRDVDELGIFARWENIQAIEDIDARTVFYQPSLVYPENQLLAEHTFLEPGWYIGVVTAPHPSKDITYNAVFPFQVGQTNYLFWLLLMLALAVAGFYVYRSRRGS
ncbi:MAG: hypothetical protein O7F73_17115 [Gammaproteobacteria bacterium]|nr:hypothetical protein [Gammaproteobacteria bacterium]